MHIRRRPLIISTMALLVVPSAVLSQTPGKVRRVGFLWGSSKVSSEESGAARAFVAGMREAGYREHADYIVESRYAGGHYSELEAIAQEVDVLKDSLDVLHDDVEDLKQRVDAILVALVHSR